MTDQVTNPHKLVARQFRALLATENELSHDDKANSQWQILHKFCGTSIVVGKGGVNTAFVIWNGNPKTRNIMYPMDMINLLDRLSKQSHPVYVKIADGKELIFQSLRPKLKIPPTAKGAAIYGLKPDGQRELCYKARPNVAGKLSWIKV